MATREQSSSSEMVPNRTAKSRPRSNKRPARKEKRAVVISGPAIPEGVERAIEAERDNLSKAESLLGCLAIAMEHGAWEHEDEVVPPYYPDVARMARNLVRQSINGLDSLNLEKHLARRRIKEQTDVYGYGPCPEAAGTQPWPLMRLARDSMPLYHRQAM
jgi:hypothetical protein